MSNRTLVELNHDYCPLDDDEKLLAWARSMVFYMRGADAYYLPPGVTFKHIRHHSEPCPMAERDALQERVQRLEQNQRTEFSIEECPKCGYKWGEPGMWNATGCHFKGNPPCPIRSALTDTTET